MEGVSRQIDVCISELDKLKKLALEEVCSSRACRITYSTVKAFMVVLEELEILIEEQIRKKP